MTWVRKSKAEKTVSHDVRLQNPPFAVVRRFREFQTLARRVVSLTSLSGYEYKLRHRILLLPHSLSAKERIDLSKTSL